MPNTHTPFHAPLPRTPDGHSVHARKWPKKEEPDKVKESHLRTDVRHFVDLSYHLTGFERADLFGTGSAEEYLSALVHRVGADNALRLYKRVVDPKLGKDPQESARFPDHEKEADLYAMAAAVTTMWYLGSWTALDPQHYALVVKGHKGTPPLPPNETFVVSPNAYLNGLVWQLTGGHALGGKPTGWATWAERPPKVHRNRAERRKEWAPGTGGTDGGGSK
ncbi:hypothetical protein ACIBFB_17400 [Nocardiopsis sp. NPDC050513]|uniref:hypothetical protein n=1 Tax=Nocardiopsis sp. NPDC050513 TaxID=3364338 RepID=UPI0037AA3239